MTEIVPPPQVPKTTAAAGLVDLNELLNRANSVRVTNADEYASAVQVCQRISAMQKLRSEERLAITRQMDKAKQSVMDFFQSTFLTPLASVDAVIRRKLKDYDAEQRRIADEQRRRAEAEAEKQRQEIARKAREEEERAHARAKAEREEAERKRAEAEQARRAAEAAKAAGDARAQQEAAAAAAKLESAAIKAESKAERIETASAVKVDDLQARAASVVAAVVIEDRPKVKGNVRRMVKKWEVKEPAAVGRLYLMIDEKKINGLVQSLGKDAEGVVGGIRVWEEEDLTIRQAKP